MTWRDAFRLAVSGLRGSVIRTMLTILGLAVGVGAVLTVITLGGAGEERVEEEIAKLGVDKVWIRANDRVHKLQLDDAAMLTQITSAPACAGIYTVASVFSGDTGAVAQIAGFDQSMQSVHAPKILKGRGLRERDFSSGASVCLVDEALAECLGDEVIGMRVGVNHRVFRIVGVMKRMTVQNMSSGSGVLVLPISTFLDTFGGSIAEITMAVQRGQDATAVAELALQTLTSGEGFRADTLEEEINAAREVVRIFVMVLTCVAFVCMLTGGIGVMNVMLVSVRERRREIGLIKAVGATSAQVGLLFLMEASAYAGLGGLMGVALGIGMIRGFGAWIGLHVSLQVQSVVPVLIGAGVLGLVFGVAPAVKAARMQPVDALQCE